MNPIQLLCLVVGLGLLVFVTLAYEKEEQNLLDWAERAWTYLDDADRSASPRLKRLLASVAQKALGGINELYGEKALSVRALSTAVSVILSASLFFYSPIERWIPQYFLGLIAFVVLLLAYRVGRLRLALWALALSSLGGFLDPFVQAQFSFSKPPILLADASGAVTPVYLPTGWVHRLIFAIVGPPIGVLLAIPVDLGSVAIARTAFRIAAKAAQARVAFLLLTLGTVFPPLLVLACTAALPVLINYPNAPHEGDLWRAFQIAIVLNSAAILTSLLIAALLLALLTYRIAIALAPRALYTGLKFKVFENRKMMLGLSAVLLGTAYPDSLSMLEKLAKLLAG